MELERDQTKIDNPMEDDLKLLKQPLIVFKRKLKLLSGPKNQDIYFIGETHMSSLRKSRVWLCSAQLVFYILIKYFYFILSQLMFLKGG